MASTSARIRTSVTIALAVACGAVTVVWPNWRTVLEARTNYMNYRDALRMTGGGKIVGGSNVTHGFQLYCDPAQGPSHLEVNLGRGNKFHLESLTSASCTDDPSIEPNPPGAGFDTYDGTGTGRLNGVSGATAEWTFTDAGEPGDEDFADIVITDPAGNVVAVSGALSRGNHQAHGE